MPPTMSSRSKDDVGGGDPLENTAPLYPQERTNKNTVVGRNASSVQSNPQIEQPRKVDNTILPTVDVTVPRPVAYPNSASHHQPTPMFERLVTEEVLELKAYVRIVENQNKRLEELERIHGELEHRLQKESRERKHLEDTLEAREREWTEKFDRLESERNHWKKVVEAEQTKNSRLIDQVVRKDQDIHRMLQRKYDHESGRPIRNARHGDKSTQASNVTSSSRSPEVRHENVKSEVHKSPYEMLRLTGSEEKIRVRNAESFLMDFFGV